MTKEVLSQYSDLQEEIKEVRKNIARIQTIITEKASVKR